MATSLHVPGFAHGQNGSAAETDPATLSLMQGAPVPADKQVRWTDGSIWRFPQQRWAFSHMRELVPTVNIGREGAVSVLPVALRAERALGGGLPVLLVLGLSLALCLARLLAAVLGNLRHLGTEAIGHPLGGGHVRHHRRG